MASCVCALAQAQAETDPLEMTIEANLNTPQIPRKAATDIRAHIASIGAAISRHDIEVTYLRNDEVLEAVIPCSSLFEANSTALKRSAGKWLNPFASLLKYPTMYKVIVAVHSDNTGEPDYTDDLTAGRANAINTYLCEISGTGGTNLIPYGMGQEEPIADNNTLHGRASNRRVEIYVVPEKQMIQTARAGKLKQ